MTAFEIPLSPQPQSFFIQLAGTTYKLLVKWNEFAAAWVLDVGDSQGVAIVEGIPLVTGADLLAQYAYLGFTGQLIAQTDHDLDAVPTFENLGDTGHLYFVTV